MFIKQEFVSTSYNQVYIQDHVYKMAVRKHIIQPDVHKIDLVYIIQLDIQWKILLIQQMYKKCHRSYMNTIISAFVHFSQYSRAFLKTERMKNKSSFLVVHLWLEVTYLSTLSCSVYLWLGTFYGCAIWKIF